MLGNSQIASLNVQLLGAENDRRRVHPLFYDRRIASHACRLAGLLNTRRWQSTLQDLQPQLDR
jgi:hypothetical protein